jgi:putative ABC transport system permease protein
LYNRIFGALGLIIGVIVVFVVTNAMAMAIIERTREIGTLRAMGTLPSPTAAHPGAGGHGAGRCGRAGGAALSLGVSLMLYVVPVNMPPPPGRSVGYPLNISIDPLMYAATLAGHGAADHAGVQLGGAQDRAHAGGGCAGAHAIK